MYVFFPTPHKRFPTRSDVTTYVHRYMTHIFHIRTHLFSDMTLHTSAQPSLPAHTVSDATSRLQARDRRGSVTATPTVQRLGLVDMPYGLPGTVPLKFPIISKIILIITKRHQMQNHTKSTKKSTKCRQYVFGLCLTSYNSASRKWYKTKFV